MTTFKIYLYSLTLYMYASYVHKKSVFNLIKIYFIKIINLLKHYKITQVFIKIIKVHDLKKCSFCEKHLIQLSGILSDFFHKSKQCWTNSIVCYLTGALEKTGSSCQGDRVWSLFRKKQFKQGMGLAERHWNFTGFSQISNWQQQLGI